MALEAGPTEAVVYRHLSSKEELYLDIYLWPTLAWPISIVMVASIWLIWRNCWQTTESQAADLDTNPER